MKVMEVLFEKYNLNSSVVFIFVFGVLFLVGAVVWLVLARWIDARFLVFGSCLTPLIAGSGAIFFLITLTQYHSEKFAEIADEMGFDLIPKSEIDTYKFQLPLSFDLFQRSNYLGWFTNIIHGEVDNVHVTFFYYKFNGRVAVNDTYSLTNGQRRYYEVVCFQFNEPEIPAFLLSPDKAWHKVPAERKLPGIDLSEHPKFSRAYHLNGVDPDSIRRIFTDEVIQHYEQQLGSVDTEAVANALIYYRRRTSPTAAHIRAFIEDGLRVLKLFHEELQS